MNKLFKRIRMFFEPEYKNGDGCEYCKQRGFIEDGQLEGMCYTPCPQCRKKNTYGD